MDTFGSHHILVDVPGKHGAGCEGLRNRLRTWRRLRIAPRPKKATAGDVRYWMTAGRIRPGLSKMSVLFRLMEVIVQSVCKITKLAVNHRIGDFHYNYLTRKLSKTACAHDSVPKKAITLHEIISYVGGVIHPPPPPAKAQLRHSALRILKRRLYI